MILYFRNFAGIFPQSKRRKANPAKFWGKYVPSTADAHRRQPPAVLSGGSAADRGRAGNARRVASTGLASVARRSDRCARNRRDSLADAGGVGTGQRRRGRGLRALAS